MMGRPNLNDNDLSPNKRRSKSYNSGSVDQSGNPGGKNAQAKRKSSRPSNGSSYIAGNPNEAGGAQGLESSLELSQINL